MPDPNKTEIDIQTAIEETDLYLQDWIVEQAKNFEADPEVIDAIAEILDNSEFSEGLAKAVIDKYEAEVIKRYKGG